MTNSETTSDFGADPAAPATLDAPTILDAPSAPDTPDALGAADAERGTGRGVDPLVDLEANTTTAAATLAIPASTLATPGTVIATPASEIATATTAASPALRVEPISDAQRDEYNGAVEQSEFADLLQSFEWGELKALTGWRPLRYVVRDGEGNARGAFTLLEKQIPYVKRKFLYASRGPALDYADGEAAGTVLQAIRDIAAERGAAFVKIDPDIPKPRPDMTQQLTDLGFVPARFRPHWGGVQPVAVCRLALDADEDELMKSFHSKTRYNIRLAARRGVHVRQGERDDVPDFFSVWQETAARQNFATRGLDHLYQLWDLIIERGLGTMLLAEYEGELLAGVIATAFGNKAWYLYGATSNYERRRMPMYLLQWEAIRWAKQRGCRMYDFLGVSCHMNPNEPIYGLYRFKQGFNTEYTEFIGEYDLPLQPHFYKLWNWLEPRYLRTMRQVGRARRGVGRMLEAAGRGGLGPL